MADLFADSEQCEDYAAYRPDYNGDALDHVCDYAAAGLGRRPRAAVDVACGSGQATFTLARTEPGMSVTAVDASPTQVKAGNEGLDTCEDWDTQDRVQFRLGSAEATGLPAGRADLVVIAQALHWVDAPAFYAEAARLLRPGGAVAVLSYTWPTIKTGVDEEDSEVMPASTAALLAAARGPPLDAFWDPRRRAVDAGLPGLDPPPDLFEERDRWNTITREPWLPPGVGAYVRSWSAWSAWARSDSGAGAVGGPADPSVAVVEAVRAELAGSQPAAGVWVEWPVLVMVGRKKKKEKAAGRKRKEKTEV
jgi:SAM-dependent methyltransferase